MPPEAAASDRGSSTRSGGTPRGPRICRPGRLCPACTMAGRRPALRAEAERTRVVVRWLSTATRVPVGCGHIGFAQAPHPKADRACQPHGRSHLGVGLARRASQFPGRCRCSGACRTLLERRLPLPTRLGSRRVAAVAVGQVFDLPCRRRRQRPTADRRQGAAGRRVVRELVAPDACALRVQWQVEDLPYARTCLRAEAERARVVVRWLSTATRVPVGCGHIGFAQAPHPKADRACQPHGRSHLGVGLARRASPFPGRCRCSRACRTLLERRLPLPTRLGSRRVAAVAVGQVFDLPCRRRRQRPTADRRQGAAGRRVVREFVAPDACALRVQWQVEDLPYTRKRSEPALSC